MPKNDKLTIAKATAQTVSFSIRHYILFLRLIRNRGWRERKKKENKKIKSKGNKFYFILNFYYSNKVGIIDSTNSIAIITLNRFIPTSLLISFFKTTPPIAQEFAETDTVKKNIIVMIIIWVVAFSTDVTYTDIAVIILIQFFGLIHWNKTIGINFKGCEFSSFSLNFGVEFAIFQANHNKYNIPITFNIVKANGYILKNSPSPRPTNIVINGKPIITPKICGIVLLYPNVNPEDKSIMLFGPGVMDVANENINIDINSVNVKVSIFFPFLR